MNANTKLSLASLLLLAFVSTLVGQDKVPAGAFVVEEVDGRVERFDEALGAFVPVLVGFVIDRPVLVLTAPEATLVFSCSGGMAGMVSENTRVLLEPATVDKTYMADLRKGTVAILLDPDRPKDGSGFSVRTAQGVTSATGTFYAVTEFKGQTYTKVKRGSVKRRVIQPTRKDFAAYLSKSKSKPKPSPPPATKPPAKLPDEQPAQP